LTQEQLDFYLNRFPDHQIEKGESVFEFFKKSVKKQRRMRELLYGFIWETNN